MPDKQWAVREAVYDPRVSAPERLTGADIIEVRVTLTPLRWHELTQAYQARERIGGQCQVTRLEARDHRAVFHVTRQMIDEMFKHYMGVTVAP